MTVNHQGQKVAEEEPQNIKHVEFEEEFKDQLASLESVQVDLVDLERAEQAVMLDLQRKAKGEEDEEEGEEEEQSGELEYSEEKDEDYEEGESEESEHDDYESESEEELLLEEVEKRLEEEATKGAVTKEEEEILDCDRKRKRVSLFGVTITRISNILTPKRKGAPKHLDCKTEEFPTTPKQDPTEKKKYPPTPYPRTPEINEYLMNSWDLDAFEKGDRPRIKITEDDTAVTLFVELPGLSEESLSMTLDKGRILTLAGDRSGPRPAKRARTETVVKDEIGSGRFNRSLRVPSNINVGSITSSFHAGILTIEMKKLEEAKEKSCSVM